MYLIKTIKGDITKITDVQAIRRSGRQEKNCLIITAYIMLITKTT